MFKVLPLIPLLFSPLLFAKEPGELAKATAEYAVTTYQQAMVDSLKSLVRHNTVAVEGVPSPDNPVHQAFKQDLIQQAGELGLDYQDYGYVVVIGLGEGPERIGLVTHGDIQPVNPDKWAKSPFELDMTTEPGKLLGRGTEDDKGPISTALYAMKAIKDQQIPLTKRIELYVYMAEESDWAPLQAFIKTHELPELNITIDTEYPVVTAEKGYGTLSMTFPHHSLSSESPYLESFEGGFFGSQIPEDARAVIANASQALLERIKQKAAAQTGMQYDYQWRDDSLIVTALGRSAHSSKPENGVNAITHLAEALDVQSWPTNAAGALVTFINEQLGTGLYGKKFGDIAYEDAFMGPMTVSPTVIKQLDAGIQLNINIRRPRGKTAEQLEQEINQAVDNWQVSSGVILLDRNNRIDDPFVQTDAPHVGTLLSVFSHYSGMEDAQPVSIGGASNSRLFPTAVGFGPSMPGEEYTGHSEHEFISLEQFVLNLKMYTAVLVELAH
ncbi:dipeptidase [Bowmanella dokdonensis]|uniref:Dipeptidase n=1 Tax=Bowmanella dokdonensis TaxID=751969 RepID=A0A939DP06_9ALTE|nr:dipeptidase [Bowmanella dokdonensis]MBN7826162.1 dipeptidase [Bowmanella dokdonensis]